MQYPQDHRAQRSTATWLARIAVIMLSPTPMGDPVVAYGRAETGPELKFARAVPT